jgi:methylaspartate ammonia-lyase
VLVEEFDLPAPTTAVALQMPVRRGQRLQLYEKVSTLAYAVDGTSPEAALGANGERIQRFVRRLRERLVAVEQQRQMTIHLDVAGGLGRLFDEDAGKILGALYGLEKAAAPCLIRVQDPVIMADLDQQNEIWGQLRDYMRMRGMALQLVASAGISTLADVEALAQAGAAHLLHLRMPQLGTIQELMVASQLCRTHDVGILLEQVPSAMNSQVALAIQPDVLTYPISWPAEMSIATFHNEMARTLAWLTQGTA